MADFGILPNPYQVDQGGDWSDFVELILDEVTLAPDDLTGATASATLGSVPLTAVITLPNIVTWSAMQEDLAAAKPGSYTLKILITRATGFRQVALRGTVILIP